MSIFKLQARGIENVGFLAQDLYNDKRDRKNVVHGHDANMLYEHFEMEQQKNPSFRFTFERDDNDRITHYFWADATSRKSYQYFGDVVVFDTTYYTNKYSLIFAPILGVNHHRQTTFLGYAFLSDEKIDSFVWLFHEWLKAMPGGPSKMIITDQDPAMTRAITSALPNTFHRYCIWHIVSKFSEKLDALSYKEHYDELKNCIWNSEIPGEFDARWATIVRNSKLSSNKWLQDMYEIRDRWREEIEGVRIREISVDKSSNRVSCSCKIFEFDQIPCRHLLAYLFRMQIRELPTEYILQRWTKTAKMGRLMDD
ncbi:protein FAR1-RELATED SEQUENCE 7-like [Rhododendron vialii]|uniref:protein FAR1-RELATED SEQUENCE 7-like n=1 Tax=Rhododendron vialii TaxID=182163 RepID=UPI00265DC49D|nr:protein FAR1-RELATED SEQUENCE 7-like [Rhododendron vialii]